jgi:hypothetical protein
MVVVAVAQELQQLQEQQAVRARQGWFLSGSIWNEILRS